MYAVLSVGPGWDWTTLVGLYPSVDVYTTQLRALEAYCRSNKSAQAWFVLAYHYLTQGFTDAAVTALKKVVQISPNDTLSAKLLKQLDAPKPAADVPAPPEAPRRRRRPTPRRRTGPRSTEPGPLRRRPTYGRP